MKSKTNPTLSEAQAALMESMMSSQPFVPNQIHNVDMTEEPQVQPIVTDANLSFGEPQPVPEERSLFPKTVAVPYEEFVRLAYSKHQLYNQLCYKGKLVPPITL